MTQRNRQVSYFLGLPVYPSNWLQAHELVESESMVRYTKLPTIVLIPTTVEDDISTSGYRYTLLKLPTILLKPTTLEHDIHSPIIVVFWTWCTLSRCPVYMTAGRLGEDNTAGKYNKLENFKFRFIILYNFLGHSSNYIFSICLPTSRSTAHWINRRVAAICQVQP